MRVLAGIGLMLVAALALSARPADHATPRSSDVAAARAAFGSLPLAFEPNVGQAPDDVQFIVHHGRAATAVDANGTITRFGGSEIAMRLLGATPATFTGTDQLASVTNYLRGNDPDTWRHGVANFAGVNASNVYPGIDLRYYGTNSQLEHDFIVAPGVDYRQIAFSFSGQDALAIDNDGNLVLTTGSDTFRVNAPVTYQTNGAATHTVPSRFELNNNTVTVAVGDYDRSQPLVIDPSFYYSTYLGDWTDDHGYNIAVDSAGYAYVSGTTDGDFPWQPNGFDPNYHGNTDVFVSKFDTEGSSLIYSTYVGGNGEDIAGNEGLAIDNDGYAYVVGTTDSDDLPLSNEYQSTPSGGTDAFFMKLTPDGGWHDISTYFGGSGDDHGEGISVRSSTGDIVIAGYTNSDDFPVTVGVIQDARVDNNDGFVAKFGGDGTLYQSTYFGGSGDDRITAVAVADWGGHVFITGFTDTQTDFPIVNASQPSYGGWTHDAFVARLYDELQGIDFSTYLGADGDDIPRSIALSKDIMDGNTGDFYVTGQTEWYDFPTQNAYQPQYSDDGWDAFLTRFDWDGYIVTSTYLGGNGDDVALGVAVDPANTDNVFVTGYTTSSDFPVADALQGYGGGQDAFITKFTGGGSGLAYSTYVGGGGDDGAGGVALDGNANPYVVGGTDSNDFPIAGTPPYQSSLNGGYDVFAFRLGDGPTDATSQADHNLLVNVTPVLNFSFSVGSTVCNIGSFSPTQTKFCTHTMTAAVNTSGGYTIAYTPTTTLTSGGNTITAMASQDTSTPTTEQFGFNLVANTTAAHTASNFGANPSGGFGAALSGYDTANEFKFAVGGGDIASAGSASDTTVYTVSYIANVDYLTEAGTYSTPVTYTISVNY